MKRLTSALTLILLLCMIISGCKKDNKEETTTNFLKVGSFRSDLSNGMLLSIPYDDTLNCMILELLSSGITVHGNSTWPDSLSGRGNTITFMIYTTASDKLPLGQYTVKSPADPYQNGTLVYPAYILDWNINHEPDPAMSFTTSGTLKIIQNNAEYELSFSGKDMSNTAVSCNYRGSVRFHSYYGDKKMGKHNYSGNLIKSLIKGKN